MDRDVTPPHPPFPVRLPDLPGPHVQRRQPAAAVAVGVDALQVAEVEDLAALLRRVADDDRLARVVRAGGHVPQRLPPQHADGLLGHREVGVVVGVDEDVGVGLVVVEAAFEELEVLLGDEREVPPGAVGVERRDAAHAAARSSGGRPERASRSIWSWLPRSGTRRQRRPRSMSRSRTPRLSGPRLM